MFAHTFQWTLSEFVFNFQIFFTIQFHSKYSYNTVSLILRTWTHLILKFICSGSTAKNLSDCKFSSTHVSVWCQKKNCISPFLDIQEPHSWSTLTAHVCLFLYIFVTKFLFQRRSKVLSDGGGLNNFLKEAYCLSLVKCG